uniref:Histone H2A n=1 Tax=Timema bartmani TaxID=61472 RepID=A0A7R9EU96_9NEOP|nr:unnamed protein product [Timema bartmani]
MCSRCGSLLFPVGMIHHLLRKGNYSEQVGAGFPVSLAGVMKYLAAKVLDIARKKPGQQENLHHPASSATGYP